MTQITGLPRCLGKPFCGNIFLFRGATAVLGQGLLIIEASRPQSIRLLWTNDQPDAETSTSQHTTITTDRHPCHRLVSNSAIPASERPQTDALDRAATGIGVSLYYLFQIRNHPTGDLSRVVWVFMFKIQNGSKILWEVFVLKFIFTEVTLKAKNSLHVWHDAV
jgi:hypothetical protein